MNSTNWLLLAAIAGCACVLGPWLDNQPSDTQAEQAAAADYRDTLKAAQLDQHRRKAETEMNRTNLNVKNNPTPRPIRLTPADVEAVQQDYALRGRRVAGIRTLVNAAMHEPLPPQRPPVLREGAEDFRAIPSLGMRTPEHLLLSIES